MSQAAISSFQKNLDCYSIVYQSLDPHILATSAADLTFFDQAIRKHTSWHGLYRDGFASRLKGKTVLELGFGNGLNALFMAQLGARVTALEIIESSGAALRQASEQLGLNIEVLCGDVTAIDLPAYDFIVGKAFLHHLDPQLERECLEKCAALLKPGGEARFVEPAVNSQFFDRLRWMIPVPSRPSILQKERFAEWKARDPHPDRDNSTRHFEEACGSYFSDVKVVPFGGIERLRRLIPGRSHAESFAAWALRAEPYCLPAWMRRSIARTQTISCSNPHSRPRV